MKKYELTPETMNHSGIQLHRIRALAAFGSVKAGDLGGWIEKEENLSQEGAAWVRHNAKVFGEARVYGDAEIWNGACVSGEAQVYGSARVAGSAEVSGQAKVSMKAHVYEDAKVSGSAEVTGCAKVYGGARLSGKACLAGDAQAHGDASVSGDACVSTNDADLSGEILGNMEIAGNADVRMPEHALEVGPIGRDCAFASFYRTESGGIEVAFRGRVMEINDFPAFFSGDPKAERTARAAVDLARLQLVLEECPESPRYWP